MTGPEGDISNSLSFDRIYHYNSLTPTNEGKFKVGSGGIGWKNKVTGQVVTIPAADIDSLSMISGMTGDMLEVVCKQEKILKFEGFLEGDESKIDSFFREEISPSLGIERLPLDPRGTNWGELVVQDGHLKFIGRKEDADAENEEVYKMNLSLPGTISTVTDNGKNDLTVELLHRKVANRAEDEVVELRFWIPNDKEEEGEGEDTGEDGEEGEERSKRKRNTLKSLSEQIGEYSQLNQIIGQTLFKIPNTSCTVPRGRFDMELTTKYLKLRGKSYDHKILYESIIKVFMLPKNDDIHVHLLLTLDPPIKQGQTRYPQILLSFDKDEQIALELEGSNDVDGDEEKIAEILKKYSGQLEKSYEGPSFKVIGGLLKVLAGQKIITAGNSFTSALSSSSTSLKCAFKASEGFLYPLERNLIFLPKPITILPLTDISHVEFERMGVAGRSIDLRLHLTNRTQMLLSNIDKEEFAGLQSYFSIKNVEISVKDEVGRITAPSGIIQALGDSSTDEDYTINGSSEEDEERGSGSDSSSSDGEYASGDDASDLENDDDPVSGSEEEEEFSD